MRTQKTYRIAVFICLLSSICSTVGATTLDLVKKRRPNATFTLTQLNQSKKEQFDKKCKILALNSKRRMLKKDRNTHMMMGAGTLLSSFFFYKYSQSDARDNANSDFQDGICICDSTWLNKFKKSFFSLGREEGRKQGLLDMVAFFGGLFSLSNIYKGYSKWQELDCVKEEISDLQDKG